ncbi:Domain of unknown function DUF4371 [Cinara cedri]|uniref:DUF4371 domain-containing protein n=1 Tax=Cinara cedri TaxID=506608 RepID=A0A5E4MV19_9HEMI|nr:Domain of unknown function DUF4371 [Cinara cedri]
MIDSQIRVEVARNRTMLESFIRCAIYCALQDIENKGNFLELVKLLFIESQTFCSAYEALPKNSKYTSKIIQNDMISAASTMIAQSILKEVQEVIKERFLGFVELKDLNANVLSCNIKLFLNNFGLDLSNCVSQSYNGASVMSGQFNGVQKKLKICQEIEFSFSLCFKKGLLEAVYEFQSSSTLRYQVFFDKTGSKVPMHCDTHWVSKFKSNCYFKNNFTLVLTALKECTESSESKEAAEAKELLIQMNSLKTITTTLDYSHCAKLIKSIMEQLINLRSEKIFINIYDEAVSVFQTSNVESNNTLHPTREQRISSTLDNYLTYSTLGASTSRKEKQNMSFKI